MKTVNIFDCEVASLTIDETVVEVNKIIKKRKPVQHVVINAGKVVLMDENINLKKIVSECPIINADGQSIVWASRFLKKPLPERVAGIDLMEELIKLSNKKGYSIYFLGAKEEVVKKVVRHYESLYPDVKIAGFRNGYFNQKEEIEIVNNIREAHADILFVAFSSPQKEYFLSKYFKELGVPFQMGVGGSFDVVAGVTSRAPKYMQKIGLEWFYRFIQEPKRMWKRYLVGNSKFIYIVLKEKFKKVN
ncbi:WecB/TagA/CpsF family glycosyltransferase [Peribacillus sp. RS7]|uniref:WecB/TagA/CpsF family glycosyltransferase n=1 Tax=Peribacillus sp. RS7 TaxID=3242679 RepID=UPI0035BFF23D